MSYIPESILSQYDGFLVYRGLHRTKITLISDKWWRPSKSYVFSNVGKVNGNITTYTMSEYLVDLIETISNYYNNKDSPNEDQ